MTSDDIASPSLDAIIRAAPAALANAKWVLSNPSEALRELQTTLFVDDVLGKTVRCRLDDAAFPWFRLGVESAFESTYFWLRGRDRLGRHLGTTTRELNEWFRKQAAKPFLEKGGTVPQSQRDELVVEFFIGGRFFGEIVLDGRIYLDDDAELRPLVLWAEYLVGLGEGAIAGSAAASPAPSGPTFPEPRHGISPKAAAVREILLEAWPTALRGGEISDRLRSRGLNESPAHLVDRVFPELEAAGCPVANDGAGYYLRPIGSGK